MPSMKVFIQFITYLLNNRNGGSSGGGSEQPSDGQNTDQGVYSEEEVRNAVYNALKTMMIEKELVVYSMTGFEYDRTQSGDYSLIVRKLMTSLMNIYIDGVRLEADGLHYTITEEPNGLFTITFSKDFMDSLGDGPHTLKMEFDGSEDVVAEIIVR